MVAVKKNVMCPTRILSITIIAIQMFLCSSHLYSSDNKCTDTIFSKLPLYFVENNGQMHETVDFYIQGLTKNLYFNSSGITFDLKPGNNDKIKRWVVKLDYMNANHGVIPKGKDKQKAVFNYFKGNVEDWKTGIGTYGKLMYSDIWQGIDLLYSGNGNNLKYDFIVKPGADPKNIILRYRGVTSIQLNETGELHVKTPIAEFEDGAPYAYQVVNGEKVEVAVKYNILEKSEDIGSLYGFEIENYDSNKTLYIDPNMLIYCGYIGGAKYDSATDIDVDNEGNAYVSGSTASTLSDGFPLIVGPDVSYNGGVIDAFVAKVAPDGTSLIYCGYIGGDGVEQGRGIAVDGSGNAFVAGWTTSQSSTFPVISGPDVSHNGEEDAFIAKISADGQNLIYCGYIGGSLNDSGYDVTVGGSGFAYVTGKTYSDESTFPIKNGPDLSYNGDGSDADAFVAKVAIDGKSMIFCGYIGGSSADTGQGIELDSSQRAYITGVTESSEATFPVIVGPDLSHNGGVDAFVTRVKSNGTGLEYCGYIGGLQTDHGTDIAVDAGSNAYVTGHTESNEGTFPVTIGPDLTYNSSSSFNGDAFVAKVNASGQSLNYCGYIGGFYIDKAFAVALDNIGNAYVVGETSSVENTFPAIVGPDLSYNLFKDGFIAMVKADGTSLNYCGYIGGNSSDSCSGVAVSGDGDAFVTGNTASNQGTFPVVIGPDLTHAGGNNDAFVAKVIIGLTADKNTLSAGTGGTVNFYLTAGIENASRNYLLLGTMSGTVPGTLMPGGLVTLPLNWDSFTWLIYENLNSPAFQNFQGTLDANSNGSAQLNTGSFDPSTAGITMHFAYALSSPWNFASNPVPVEIVP